MMKYQKDPICGIFFKRGLFKGIKNYIQMCQTRKYKNDIQGRVYPVSGFFAKNEDTRKDKFENY